MNHTNCQGSTFSYSKTKSQDASKHRLFLPARNSSDTDSTLLPSSQNDGQTSQFYVYLLKMNQVGDLLCSLHFGSQNLTFKQEKLQKRDCSDQQFHAKH